MKFKSDQSNLIIEFDIALDFNVLAKVNYLLEQGLDPNFKGENQISPLEKALLKGNLEILSKLIEHGGGNINLVGSKELKENEIDNLVLHEDGKLSEHVPIAINRLEGENFISLKVPDLPSINNQPFLHFHHSCNKTSGKITIPNFNENEDFKQLKKEHMKKGVKYHAKYHSKSADHDFVITSTTFLNELNAHNKPDAKENSKTFFKDGVVYSAKTNEPVSISHAIYVISKNGTLYVNINDSNPGHHSYFLKGKEGDELYGYGKPVACAGHITIKNGKITEIDENSGHYQPTLHQFKVAAHYLSINGVLSDSVDFTSETNMHPSDVENLLVGEIADKYTEVQY